MIFIDEKLSVIQSLLYMAIAGYAVMIIVPLAADGHGNVREIFYT